MINFFLLLIAFVLFLLFGIMQIIYGVIDSFFSVGQNRGNILSRYFLTTAVKLDKCGNIMCGGILNLTLRKQNSPHLFGNYETVSSCLGKNERDNYLSRFGKLIAGLLNTIDKEHCKKSIE